MKVTVCAVTLMLIFRDGISSVSLSSPLTSESEDFPTHTGLQSPEPPRLVSAASYTSHSDDHSPGPTEWNEIGQRLPTITICAVDEISDKYLIERQKCNLLIVQDQHHYGASFDFQAEAIVSYFNAIDKAFAFCLEFLNVLSDPEEFGKDSYLIPFMRSLTTAIDQIPQSPQRQQIFRVFQAQCPSKHDDDVDRLSWNFVQRATMGDLCADTPIPAELSATVRCIVFKLWRAVSESLFNEELDELITLVDDPMFADMECDIPTSIWEAINKMEQFRNIVFDKGVMRPPSILSRALVDEWTFLIQFEADLKALKQVYIWNQENKRGHIVLNLLHRHEQTCDQFDLVQNALLKMGYEESNIDFLLKENAVSSRCAIDVVH